MRVAIHQPNFIPWRPFFAKMAAVDRFVILTYAQFNREHFQHRFKFQERWYTMGVENVRHPDLIKNRVYANPQEDWAKIKRRVPQHAAWFSQFDDCIHPELVRCNLAIILRMAKLLGIETEVIIDPIPSCTGTDRLVEICYALGAKTYLAGRSGAKYMEPDKFEQRGIHVEYQTVTDTRHVFET
jgi:hypothetical protein